MPAPDADSRWPIRRLTINAEVWPAGVAPAAMPAGGQVEPGAGPGPAGGGAREFERVTLALEAHCFEADVARNILDARDRALAERAAQAAAPVVKKFKASATAKEVARLRGQHEAAAGRARQLEAEAAALEAQLPELVRQGSNTAEARQRLERLRHDLGHARSDLETVAAFLAQTKADAEAELGRLLRAAVNQVMARAAEEYAAKRAELLAAVEPHLAALEAARAVSYQLDPDAVVRRYGTL